MTRQATIGTERARETHYGLFAPVASGVGRLATVFVNLYAVDLPDRRWVLVDTGLPKFAWYVRRAVESRYGAGARPEAIVLTHGHFDHSGNAPELADAWDVPVYAHALEFPYLTRDAQYPPGDPTRGGAISFLSRFFPERGMNLSGRLLALPENGSIPSMPGWRWVHTPGHTPGHVSLLRESDQTLLAGDAVVTTDLDGWSSQFTWPRELSRPPTPMTPDWFAARQSIRRLAELDPSTLAAGHGLPMAGRHLGDALRAFADAMPEPTGGRFAGHPVTYAPDGSVAALPPPVADPLPQRLALGMAVAGVVAIAAVAALRRQRKIESVR